MLPASKPAETLAHTGAACGAHRGRKSRTGAVAFLGSGSTYSSSTSQSVNTTSSSESEQIGLPGALEPALLTRSSLTEQGYSATETAVLQDNTSTVSLVSSGAGSSSKSRHIDTRHFFKADRLEQVHLRVEHLEAADT